LEQGKRICLAGLAAAVAVMAAVMMMMSGGKARLLERLGAGNLPIVRGVLEQAGQLVELIRLSQISLAFCVLSGLLQLAGDGRGHLLKLGWILLLNLSQLAQDLGHLRNIRSTVLRQSERR
jgi:hypothetical protein